MYYCMVWVGCFQGGELGQIGFRLHSAWPWHPPAAGGLVAGSRRKKLCQEPPAGTALQGFDFAMAISDTPDTTYVLERGCGVCVEKGRFLRTDSWPPRRSRRGSRQSERLHSGLRTGEPTGRSRITLLTWKDYCCSELIRAEPIREIPDRIQRASKPLRNSLP